MRNIVAILAWLAATMFTSAVSAEVTDAEKAANAEAMATGKLIYQYDQAAWHSTDAMLALIKLADYPDLRGWIVEPNSNDTLLVTYFGQRDGPRFAVLRYVMRGSTIVEGGLVPASADASLSPLANRMVDARDAASKSFAKERLGLCTNGSPNSVVLPPDQDGRLRAYIMSAAVTQGVFPLGGHYRFDIGSSGEVQSWRPFMKTCILVDTRPNAEMKEKVAFFTSHLLDPQPTEIHYFVRYNVPVDMAVSMADGDVWMLGVEGLVKMMAGEPPRP